MDAFLVQQYRLGRDPALTRKGHAVKIPWSILSVFVLVIVASCGLSGYARSATNLLTNGSFEMGPNHGIGDGCPSDLPGWCVYDPVPGGDNGVDYVWDEHVPCDGTYYLDLNDSQDAGAIYQDFPTVAGVTYSLTFCLGGNTDGPPTLKQLLMKIDGNSTIVTQPYVFDDTGYSRSTPGWVTEQVIFVANSATTRVTFESHTDGPFGPDLDSVCVVPSCAPVPPGAVSWWQFEGSAGDFFGSNGGTVTGSGAFFAAGEVGQGFHPAPGSNITIPRSPSLDVTNFTVDAWVKLDSLPATNPGIIWNGNFLGQSVTGTLGLGIYGYLGGPSSLVQQPCGIL